MVPICRSRKSIFVRSVRYTSSIITRNMAMSRETVSNNPIESAMREKLSSNLNPTYLKIINESYLHNVPRGSETHFKVIIVSDKFENVSLIQRHRMVNELLQQEFANGIHALSLIARTPKQWSEDDRSKPSPSCLGGKK